MISIFQRRRQAAAILLSLLLAAATQSPAQTTVRGRLVMNTPQGQFPVPNVWVSLFNPNIGRSTFSLSGGDGMYYLFNVPQGDYSLEIWTRNPPLTFGISAMQPRQFTDIAPIAVW